MAALGGGPAQVVTDDADVLAVTGPLAAVLPGGGLPRRAVTHVSDTPLLIAELIERVAESGGYAGVVGWPEFSYAGIAAGSPGNLERVIAVPEPGIEDIAVAGVLAEGLDLVVLRTRVALELTPVRARPLLARLRGGNAALLCVNVAVPSPALRIDATVSTFHGIGPGTGRISGIDLRVRAQAKGARAASATVTLGTGDAHSAHSARETRPRLTVV